MFTNFLIAILFHLKSVDFKLYFCFIKIDIYSQ